MTYVNVGFAILFGVWAGVDIFNGNWKWHGAPMALALGFLNASVATL